METYEEHMIRMATDVPDEFMQVYFDGGCLDYSDRFGVVVVPDDYSILLNADGTHFFWVRHSDEVESCIYCNRFDALRSAKEDAKKELDK